MSSRVQSWIMSRLADIKRFIRRRLTYTTYPPSPYLLTYLHDLLTYLLTYTTYPPSPSAGAAHTPIAPAPSADVSRPKCNSRGNSPSTLTYSTGGSFGRVSRAHLEWISSASRGDLKCISATGRISARSRMDLGEISVASRRDLEWISARSRMDLGDISNGSRHRERCERWRRRVVCLDRPTERRGVPVVSKYSIVVLWPIPVVQ